MLNKLKKYILKITEKGTEYDITYTQNLCRSLLIAVDSTANLALSVLPWSVCPYRLKSASQYGGYLIEKKLKDKED